MEQPVHIVIVLVAECHNVEVAQHIGHDDDADDEVEHRHDWTVGVQDITTNNIRATVRLGRLLAVWV